MSSTKVTLRHHKPKGDKVPPVVVTFPHGPPPPECFTGTGTSGPNTLGALQVEYCANTQGNRASQRVVAARNGKMKYRGTNFGRFSSSLSLSKYMVGVYNRDTKHVDMYDVDGIFALQQQPLRAASALSLRGSIDGGVTDFDRRKMLISTFGSRKKQNLQKSREAGVVDAGNVTAGTAVSRLLKKHAAEVKPASGAGTGAGAGADGSGAGAGAPADAVAAAQAATRQMMLPPVNLEATTLDGAYPVDGLVTREEQAALMPAVKEMLATIKKPAQLAELRSSQAYCDYILDHLDSMPKDKKELRAAMRLVVYMDHLMRLFETPFVLRTNRGDSSFGEAEESVPHLAGIPPVIQERLLSTFCQRQVNKQGRTSYVRTSFLRDKLLMHICALALTIDKYALDITCLATDLKMQPKQLAAYFRELGCTYKSRGPVKRKRGDEDGEAAAVSGYTVALRVPLKFPKAKKMRR